MHVSIPVDQTCEFINITPVNPMISKCQIKVCYVSDEPNRNGSVITKAVAREMANSLPGCPIVGFFNKEKQDFEEHNRVITITNNSIEFEDTTVPYGFVDMNPKVWFKKFQDDGTMIEREYLMTEGYIWTGQYPECSRIISKGNNQSMELDTNTIDGTWSKDDNGEPQFFIINKAIISKLCILGEDVEPCFEGSQITRVQFALDEEFENKFFSMADELKKILNEGGTYSMDESLKDNELLDQNDVEFKKAEEEKKQEEEKKEEGKKEEPKNEEKKDDEKKSEEEDDKKKKKYSLDEIEEYQTLQASYTALENQYKALEEEVKSLREFKLSADRTAKEEMIKSFYMLSDEDKKEVVENIDTYSLDDIEAKLSIICVRNKVNFTLDEEKKEDKEKDALTFNLNGENAASDNAPAWVKAVRDNMKK